MYVFICVVYFSFHSPLARFFILFYMQQSICTHTLCIQNTYRNAHTHTHVQCTHSLLVSHSVCVCLLFGKSNSNATKFASYAYTYTHKVLHTRWIECASTEHVVTNACTFFWLALKLKVNLFTHQTQSLFSSSTHLKLFRISWNRVYSVRVNARTPPVNRMYTVWNLSSSIFGVNRTI